jgi:hypothetical protein
MIEQKKTNSQETKKAETAANKAAANKNSTLKVAEKTEPVVSAVADKPVLEPVSKVNKKATGAVKKTLTEKLTPKPVPQPKAKSKNQFQDMIDQMNNNTREVFGFLTTISEQIERLGNSAIDESVNVADSWKKLGKESLKSTINTANEAVNV